MKKINLSLIHILIVAGTLFLCISKLNGQERPEMIPYRLVPMDYDPDEILELEIELIHPYQIQTLVEVHKQETVEIIYERIGYEIINPESRNEIFKIDGKLYYLIRIPYTGVPWNISY